MSEECISREAAIERLEKLFQLQVATARTIIDAIPAADVVEEENILKFYYVRSIDEYWIGQRIDNFYYAEYDPKNRQWVWTHSRYLPWGKHIVAPDTFWKEHAYPSEPEEMPFGEWLTGFIKKHIAAEARQELDEAYKKLPAKDADVPGKWISTKDRLPCDERPVLACYGFDGSKDANRRWYGVLTYFAFETNPHWQHETTGLHVTHWMPLPEPPRKEFADGT